jgi:muramoyltetrapeptide carboxypeptidase LdcA involved in peptidoglycan recycling
MKKLSKEQIARYLNYLEKYKCLVGFSDWSVKLNKVAKNHGQKTIAFVGIDIWEKELTVELTENFLEKPKDEQENVLLHELVHGRVRYFKERMKEFEEVEEEHLVNDLTRGITALTNSTSIKIKKINVL